jgi:protein-tyrosine phosphatase
VIDLHCHILPALDDGARDMSDSVAMARQGEADGVSLVCATPHIRSDHHVAIPELPERVAEVNAAIAAEHLALRVVVGGEVAQAAVDGLEDDELRAVSLGGGGRWILLEPAPGPLGDGLLETVERLALRGFCAVIAHPERHAGADVAERLHDLAGAGALIQFTAALLDDPGAEEWVLGLARRGLVHLLGSDSHSAAVGRPLAIRRCIERLGAVDLVRPHLGWIATEAPGAILRGEPVRPPFPAAL